MPFTISHVAAVLPLMKKNAPTAWLSWTGLIVGAMIPDFEYFLRMRVRSEWSHDILTGLLFNIPLGLIVCYLFHNVVRDRFIAELPSPLQKRWRRFRGWSWNNHFNKQWKAVLISLIIGSLTHVLWDGFTHFYGFFVSKLDFLKTEIGGVRLYRLLQHISSVVGAAFLFWAIYKMPQEKKAIKPVNGKYWLAIILVMMIVFSAWGLTGNNIYEYKNAVVALISSFLIALLFAPTFVSEK